MKALSLRQPHALFVVRGVKQFETRAWKTSYRGTLVIQAAQTFEAKERDCLANLIETFNFGWPYTALPGEPTWFGAALGTVELVDVIPVENLNLRRLSRLEKALGDYSSGRYAWKLANPILFEQPIVCAGWPGLWEVA